MATVTKNPDGTYTVVVSPAEETTIQRAVMITGGNLNSLFSETIKTHAAVFRQSDMQTALANFVNLSLADQLLVRTKLGLP